MSDSIIVYWAPQNCIGIDEKDWSIIVNEPRNVYSYLIKNINKDNSRSFFECPSFKNFGKQTFFVTNPIKLDAEIKNNVEIIYNSKNYINSEISKLPSIKNNTLFNYPVNYLFFCEEDLEMSLSSPYFHYAPHLKYGCVVPGDFNVGSWFRQTNFEFNLWDEKIIIEENEPIAYFRFKTNKKIILKRFVVNEAIARINNVCCSSSQWESRVPLSKRYNRFKKTKMNKILLNEIKKNIIED